MQNKIIWHTEKRKVKDLHPYGSNPRQITQDQLDQLKRSLTKFDYCELIACNPDGQIIAGHMRVKAMLQLGWGNKEIEVRVPARDLDPEELREYLIRSNRNTGDWDWDELGNNWDPVQLCEWGFSAEEIAGEILDIEKEEEINPEIEKCPSCGQKIKKKKC